MQIRPLAAVFGAALALAWTAAPAAAQQELKLRHQKGDVLKYRIANSWEVEADLSALGQAKQEITLKQAWELTFKVLEVSEQGLFKMEARFSRVSGQGEMFGQTFEWDSDKAKPPVDKDGKDKKEGGEGDPKPPAVPGMPGMQGPAGDALVKFAGAFKGGKFTLWLSPYGKVTKVKGMQKILDAARKKAGLPDAGDEGGGMPGMPGMGGIGPAQLADMFSDREVQKYLQVAFVPLPEKPVSAGDTWKGKDAAAIPMVGHDYRVNATYALAGVEKGTARIIGDGAVAIAKSDPPGMLTNMLNFDVKKASFAAKVALTLDAGAFQSVEKTVSIDMQVESAFGGGGGMGGGQEMPKMPAKGVTKTSITLLSHQKTSGDKSDKRGTGKEAGF